MALTVFLILSSFASKIPNGTAIKEFNVPDIRDKMLLSNGWFICRKNSYFFANLTEI